MKLDAERVAGGFQFLEGPVWVASRQELLFSDIPANRIYRWKDGSVEVWREPSHQANGNTLDPQGRLVTCEHETRRVTRTELDGTIVPVRDWVKIMVVIDVLGPALAAWLYEVIQEAEE